MSPLQVMMHAMSLAANEGNWAQAANFARECAPYCHPKLSSVDLNATVKRDAAQMTDDQLIAVLSAANSKIPTREQQTVN